MVSRFKPVFLLLLLLFVCLQNSNDSNFFSNENINLKLHIISVLAADINLFYYYLFMFMFQNYEAAVYQYHMVLSIKAKLSTELSNRVASVRHFKCRFLKAHE